VNLPLRAAPAGRLVGLDGVRGLAATFVVLHHCWLLSYPGYPNNTGPFWTGWLVYGHFAVVVFIALSGFSLAVSPARHEWQLGSKARFAHRRAWRILPPYWAALVFSLIIAWTIVSQPGAGTPNGKSVVVHGLLLQDVFGSNTPNGAFWSIAIEAQLYLVFPLLLLALRRTGAAIMVAGVAFVVVAIGVFGPHVSVVDKLMRFTPQFAVLFAGGLAAASILRASDRIRALPWHWVAGAAALPVIVLIAFEGPRWTVEHYYWIDLALAPAVCVLLAALATRRPVWFVRLLDTRPLRSLGSFSYSLYLIHAPIVVVVSLKLVAPIVGSGLPRFLLTLMIAVPLSLAAARLFAAFFEIPFTRHRTWPELRVAMIARYEHIAGRIRTAGVRAPAVHAGIRAVRARLSAAKPEQLATAVPDGAALATEVHPVDGGAGSRPLRSGEVGVPNDP
jgi:peptidoglycan/LPS O-acetylase OafA/YrhL